MLFSLAFLSLQLTVQLPRINFPGPTERLPPFIPKHDANHFFTLVDVEILLKNLPVIMRFF